MTALTAVTVLCFLHTYSINQVAKRTYIGGVIVHDKGNRPAYFEIAETSGAILNASGSPQAESIRNQALFSGIAAEKLLLPYGLFEAADHAIKFVQGHAALAQVALELETRREASRRPTLQWMVALVCFALGAYAWKQVRALGPILSLSSAVAAASIVTRSCETCVQSLSMEAYSAALVGTVLFTLASVVGFAVTEPKRTFFLSLSFVSTIIAQAFLYYNAEGSCLNCLLIFGIGSLYLGSCLAPRDLEAKTPSKRLAFCAATVAIFILVVVGRPSAASPPEKLRVIEGSTFARHLKGTDIKYLDINSPSSQPIKGPAVILIGDKTCQACRWAQRWASTLGELSVFYVHQLPERPQESEGVAHWLNSSDGSLPNPSLILIDHKGIVIDEVYGWSEEPRMKQTLKYRFTAALAVAKQKGEQK